MKLTITHEDLEHAIIVYASVDEVSCADMGVHGDGEIANVYVNELYRRRGVATAMYNYAKELIPQIRHSSKRTPAGDAWAHAVGGDVPLLHLSFAYQE